MKKLLLALLLGAASMRAEPLKLSGLMGVGFDTLPGLSTGVSGLSLINTPNAVSFRSWINEDLAWDGQLAVSVNSQPGPAGTSGANTKAFGVGTGIKYNFRRPTDLILAQLLAGLSFSQLSVGADGSGVGTPAQTTTTISLYIGTGFEAFLPVWTALSIEGSARLRVNSATIKTEGPLPATQTSSSLGFNGDGFTPLTVQLHYYF